jgi:large subunit GTPase 1
MPRQGGQGKGKPKLAERGLGKALIRNRSQTAGSRFDSGRKTGLVSELDNSGGLDEYLKEVEMEGADVEVLRVYNHDAILIQPTVRSTTLQSLSSNQFEVEQLSIPRKPAWTTNMTPEEVDRNEKDTFLQWRRDIALREAEEEKSGQPLKVTPFEKNLEVWRQLWRVIERCDMAIQIVDARNPLLYFTNDLMTYASEQTPSKPVMLIVNKADFLTEYQRKCWAETLESMSIKFVYYSAKDEQDLLDASASATGDDSPEADEVDIEALANDLTSGWQSQSFSAEPDDQKTGVEVEEVVWGDPTASFETASRAPRGKPGISGLESSERARRMTKVLSRKELVLLMTLLPRNLELSAQIRHGGRVCIGLLGYPNVGKSSVINTILGVSKKTHGTLRVAVSSTPGKTKHFQTLMVSDSLMLCDCPGLVFPSFMQSTAEMICAGILPINQMRDSDGPAGVIASRIQSHLLEAAYGMKIRRELDFKVRFLCATPLPSILEVHGSSSPLHITARCADRTTRIAPPQAVRSSARIAK